MVITDRTWHHDALGHLAEAAHSDISVRRRELRRITVGFTDFNGDEATHEDKRRTIHVRKIRAVREVAFDPTEAAHTASRGGATKHIVVRSTMVIKRIVHSKGAGESGSPSAALRGNDVARAMATVLCGSSHASDGPNLNILAPPDVALLEAQQLNQRALHDIHRHHRHGGDGESKSPDASTEGGASGSVVSGEREMPTETTTTTAKPRRFRTSRGVADDDMALQQACTTFTSCVTDTLKGAMSALAVLDKLYAEIGGKWESIFKGGLDIATMSGAPDDGETKEQQKDRLDQLWTESMDEIKAKVDLFYVK